MLVLTLNNKLEIVNEREDLNTVTIHNDDVQGDLISCSGV